MADCFNELDIVVITYSIFRIQKFCNKYIQIHMNMIEEHIISLMIYR